MDIELRRLIRTKAVGDTPLLEVVRRHLHFHTIPGENADPVNAHSSCESAEKLMSFYLIRGDLNAEGSIWKCFFHYANELNYILRHR